VNSTCCGEYLCWDWTLVELHEAVAGEFGSLVFVE
jgi:hypothetical protein